jgi:hypothetical protein
LVAQAYRAALLNDTDLGPSARGIVDATVAALTRLGLRSPANRRWPVRIDLAAYAEELSAGSDKNLLRWISELVTQRSTIEVTASQLNSWLAAYPWALILDGLDEVPSVAARTAVYEQLDQFWAKIDDLDADVLMVVTTRPTGYDDQLTPERFEHVLLQQLVPTEAADLAERLAASRFVDDDEMRDVVVARMRAAASDPSTARLMGTPLQVTIMSMIVEKHAALPPNAT